MNLEAVALTSPLRPSGPKQGHSDKGQIEDPFLKTLLSWKEDLEELILGEQVDLLELRPIHRLDIPPHTIWVEVHARRDILAAPRIRPGST